MGFEECLRAAGYDEVRVEGFAMVAATLRTHGVRGVARWESKIRRCANAVAKAGGVSQSAATGTSGYEADQELWDISREGAVAVKAAAAGLEVEMEPLAARKGSNPDLSIGGATAGVYLEIKRIRLAVRTPRDGERKLMHVLRTAHGQLEAGHPNVVVLVDRTIYPAVSDEDEEWDAKETGPFERMTESLADEIRLNPSLSRLSAVIYEGSFAEVTSGDISFPTLRWDNHAAARPVPETIGRLLDYAFPNERLPRPSSDETWAVALRMGAMKADTNA